MNATPEPTAADPRAEYSRRLNAHWEMKDRQDRLEAIVGNARIAVFLVGVALAYLIFMSGAPGRGWLAVPAGVFVVLVLCHERIRRARALAGRQAAYYERGLARLEGRWQGTGTPGTRFLAKDHPYLLDLDIFGTGSLFERLSTARTSAGENTLAGWLSAPCARDEIRERQEAVADLRGRLDLREQLALLGSAVPAGIDLEALARWGSAPAVLTSRRARWAAFLLVVLNVAALTGWFTGDLLLSFYLLILLVQGGFALTLKSRVKSVVAPVDRRAHDLALFAGILACIERGSFTSARLCRIQKDLDSAGLLPSRRIARLVRLVHWLDCTHNQYFALMAPLFLWTTQLAFAVEVWRRIAGPAVARWLARAGEFEALCALAAYSYENPADPFPEIAEEGPCFDGAEIGHPLLPRQRCVSNDVRLDQVLSLLVVSGSNMSGKSTLLRTVGVNTVLALAGAPVRARKLRISPLAVGATLRIQDSLQEGCSRFYAEITRVRRLVELARGPLPLLFLLDEIFHGTNSHDRRQGAEAVVSALVQLGAVGLITTHDLALTHIVDRLAPRAANVHFEDHFENGTIAFDYHMRPGIVENSNALALMRAVGLEV